MKELLVILVLTCCIGSVRAQHYGGVTFTPYAVENSLTLNYYDDSYSEKSAFSFSAGYQGLLWQEKRFSIAYGLQYTSAIRYKEFENTYSVSVPEWTVEDVYAIRNINKSIELPIAVRFNILKNTLWQPFIAVIPTVSYLFENKVLFYSESGNDKETDTINSNFDIYPDVGVGVNYTKEKWIFSTQVTYRNPTISKLGLGISIMRKF